MDNIITWILLVVFAVLGGASTLYLTVSIPIILVYKFVRRAKYKISLFD